MLFDYRLKRLARRLRADGGVRMRVALWNGATYELGADPVVTLRIPSQDALRAVLPPRLDSLGRAYVEGLVDVEGPLSEVLAQTYRLAEKALAWRDRAVRPGGWLRTRGRDRAAIEYHYDVSNDFYRLWLDPLVIYSCAYFELGDETLARAQEKKLDHILGKIMLRPGERLLDIGCGWGALIERAAGRYGARATGITLSRQQYEYAHERLRAAGLEGRCEVQLRDYRDLDPQRDGRFDKVTSVGMFEHVGLAQLRGYFERIHAMLEPGGWVLNHGITSADPDSRATPLGASRFIDQYVFPNGELPHLSLAIRELCAAQLEVTDVEGLRPHYARTLACWAHNLEAHAEAARAMVGEKRYRIWRVFLAGCAEAFERNWVSVYQLLARKPGGGRPLPWSRRYMYGS